MFDILSVSRVDPDCVYLRFMQFRGGAGEVRGVWRPPVRPADGEMQWACWCWGPLVWPCLKDKTWPRSWWQSGNLHIRIPQTMARTGLHPPTFPCSLAISLSTSSHLPITNEYKSSRILFTSLEAFIEKNLMDPLLCKIMWEDFHKSIIKTSISSAHSCIWSECINVYNRQHIEPLILWRNDIKIHFTSLHQSISNIPISITIFVTKIEHFFFILSQKLPYWTDLKF